MPQASTTPMTPLMDSPNPFLPSLSRAAINGVVMVGG
jgi:hypothetical protein